MRGRQAAAARRGLAGASRAAWRPLHDGRRGLALDEAEGGEPPLLLRLALAEGPAPAVLRVSGATLELAAAWSEALALPVEPAPPTTGGRIAPSPA